MKLTQKITPFFWFKHPANEVAAFYTSIFENSKILHTTIVPGGQYVVAEFQIAGVELIAFSGPGDFQFNQATSLQVNCKTQEEIDHLWSRLLENGGVESRCGWLTDQFGFSWQITPDVLAKYMGDKDPAKAGRAMQAMMKMVKIDIATIERAYAGN